MYKVSEEWLRSGKSKEEKEDQKQTVLNAEPAFKLLRSILLARLASIPDIKEEDYKNSDVVGLQAHRNGKKEVLNDLLRLLTFKERP
jgi:hypothetical protein